MGVTPTTIRSYVQVNLYGTSLLNIEQRGIDIPKLLSGVGFAHCAVSEIPLFSEEFHRHLDKLKPPGTENAAEVPLEPTVEIKSEILEEEEMRLLTSGNGAGCVESVRESVCCSSILHSTPLPLARVLLDCSLSTIASGIAPIAFLPSESSSLSIIPAPSTRKCSNVAEESPDIAPVAPVAYYLPSEPSSLSITPAETTKNRSQATEGSNLTDSVPSATIMACLNDALDRVSSAISSSLTSEEVIPVAVAVSPNSAPEVEDFFDCEGDLRSDFPHYDASCDVGYVADLPEHFPCEASPLSPASGPHRDASASISPQSKPSFAVKQEWDSLAVLTNVDDVTPGWEDWELCLVKEEPSLDVFTESGPSIAHVVERVISVKIESPKEDTAEPPAIEEEEDIFLDAFDYAEDTKVVKKPVKKIKYDIDHKIKCHFPYCCQDINYRTRYGPSRLLNHARKHHKVKPWKCGLCDFKAARELYVKRHHKSKHSDVIYEKAVDCAKTDHNDLMAVWRRCFPEIRQPIQATKDAVKKRLLQ